MSFLNISNERHGKEAMGIDFTSMKYSNDKYDDNDNMDGDNDICCHCKRPCFGRMILCEQCFEWFHYDCVNIVEGKEPDEFICNNCINKTIKRKKETKRNNGKNSIKKVKVLISIF